jgi:hypothetical protein
MRVFTTRGDPSSSPGCENELRPVEGGIATAGAVKGGFLGVVVPGRSAKEEQHLTGFRGGRRQLLSRGGSKPFPLQPGLATDTQPSSSQLYCACFYAEETEVQRGQAAHQVVRTYPQDATLHALLILSLGTGSQQACVPVWNWW